MKKIIALTLAALMACLSLSACGNKKPEPQTDVPSVSDTNTETPENPSGEPVNNVEWELKEMDINSEVPELTLIEAQPYDEHPAVTVKLLKSPVKFENTDDIINVLKSFPCFDGYTFYVSKYENGRDRVHYDDLGLMYRIDANAVISGYRDGEEEASVKVEYFVKPYNVDGSSKMSFYWNFGNAGSVDVQKTTFEIASKLFGEKIANVLTYAKDSTLSNSNFVEEIRYKSNSSWYKFDRYVKESSVSLSAEFDAAIYGNKLTQYTGDYKTILSDLKYSLADMFDGRLGQYADVAHESESFDKYFAIGKAGYIGSILDNYSCTTSCFPTGNVYSIENQWYKTHDDRGVTTSAALGVYFDITEAADGKVRISNLKIEGTPDDVYPHQTTEDAKTVAAGMIADAVEQISLVFGDGVDVSSIKPENFNTKDDSITMNYTTDCSFNCFGEAVNGSLTIEFYESFVETYRCSWSFTIS